MTETITSRSNKWIKCAVRLQQKKYRDEYGLFVVEGIRNVGDVIRQQVSNGVCFAEESKTEDENIRTLLSEAKKLHWLILIVSEPISDLIGNTQNGQGVTALIRKPIRKNLCDLHPLRGLYVFLDTVQDPGNLGTIIRTSAAAGCKAVFLSKGCADPYSDKVVRSAMGALLRIPLYTDTDATTLKTLAEKSRTPFIGTDLLGGKDYSTILPQKDGVFVFGNEGQGMTAAVRDLCDKRIYIPMENDVESLNVSVAAGIILFGNARCHQ